MIGYNHLGKNGRFGNQMFQYAALKGIAKKNGYDFCIPFGPREEYDFTDEENQHKLFMAFKMSNVKEVNMFGAPYKQEESANFDRDLFENCDYLGIDVGEGKGVDLVCEGQKYMIDRKPDQLRKYDVVLSTECFEHNPFWLQTFLNMIRLTKSKGLTFFTCATDGRPEHGTTRTSPADSPLTIGKGWDYYMNLNSSHFNVLDLDAHFVAHSFSGDTISRDLYFFGIKK